MVTKTMHDYDVNPRYSAEEYALTFFPYDIKRKRKLFFNLYFF